MSSFSCFSNPPLRYCALSPFSNFFFSSCVFFLLLSYSPDYTKLWQENAEDLTAAVETDLRAICDWCPLLQNSSLPDYCVATEPTTDRKCTIAYDSPAAVVVHWWLSTRGVQVLQLSHTSKVRQNMARVSVCKM